jgi:hypothetical protein
MDTSMPADFWDRVARIVADLVVNRNEAAGQSPMSSNVGNAQAGEAQQANQSAESGLNYAHEINCAAQAVW